MRAHAGLLAIALLSVTAACASKAAKQQRVTVVKPEERPAETGGIPPDKEAEIQLVLQQRESSARKCYQDVLNERHDRTFQGSVRVLIRLGTSGEASDVKVIGGTLPDEGVRSCLVQTIKGFQFPELASSGEVQYEYLFRPAY
jgi:hypothetical protein